MPVRGYIEGYYGRLPDWPDRHQLLEHLASLSMSHYFYAPKEDACHRLHWRQPYTKEWRVAFSRFCQHASNCDISVIAGIAPGLDFDFASLSQSTAATEPTDSDFARLCQKARLLLEDGAMELALLMDDIDPDFARHQGVFTSEGVAHATLANRLATALDRDIYAVPRVYADELAEESPDYLQHFCSTLSARLRLFFCGTHIVSEQLTATTLALSPGTRHETLVWDNLYANDYCPRRLFVGPYRGRDVSISLMLNPTGMLQTDRLLLTVMHSTLQAMALEAGADQPMDEQRSVDDLQRQAWRASLRIHEVPDAFLQVAEYFALPAFAGRPASVTLPAARSQLDALEVLLWKWKTPLSREWYPHLMGLKQDLLLAAGNLPLDRVHKTQLPPLAEQLVPLVSDQSVN